MGTGNFYFKNRCLVVTDEDYEDDNLPILGDYNHSESLQSFPARNVETDEYEKYFNWFNVVLVSGYYEGGCIDYRRNDNTIENYIPNTWYVNSAKELFEELNRFEETRITRYRFNKVCGKVSETMGVCYFIERAMERLEEYYCEQEEKKVNEFLDYLKEQHCYEDFAVMARFSNGETIYKKVN